jgi:hypothetical protein
MLHFRNLLYKDQRERERERVCECENPKLDE